MDMDRFELFVLGIAQDGGVPHLGCERPCCALARESGRELYPACLGVRDRESGALLLIEATPRIEKQVALLHELSGSSGTKRRPVHALLLTHAHIGHYLGLAQLGYEVAHTRELPVFVSHRMAEFLAKNGPWSQLVDKRELSLRTIQPRQPFEPLPGLDVTAIPVPHRDEFSDTLAFKIRGPRRSVLFVPDIDGWSDELLRELLDGVDVAYLDATFHDGSELPGRDISTIRHPLIVESMERLADEARARPGRLRFIHLNHTNPALRDPEIRRLIESRGFRIARPGEAVGL